MTDEEIVELYWQRSEEAEECTSDSFSVCPCPVSQRVSRLRKGQNTPALKEPICYSR